MGGRRLASTVVLLVNTFFGSDCITSGRSSHHDVVNFINTYTVAMVSTVMLSIYKSICGLHETVIGRYSLQRYIIADAIQK